MEQAVKKITENTLIPISLAVTLAGGIFWLSALWYREEANAQAIIEVKQVMKDDRGELLKRIDKLEDKIDYIIERLPK